MAKNRSSGGTSLVVRWAINAVAIWAAVELLPGIEWVDNSFVAIAIIALIFGLVNALIRPLITLLTCPLLILTLGLGTLLINAGMFALTGWLGRQFGFGFTIGGFWDAFLGALIVSIVSAVLSSVLGGKRSKPDND